MITKTTFAAILASKSARNKLRSAIYKAGKLGYSVAHVDNRNGEVFLAVRVRNNILQITDSQGNNVTQEFKQSLKGL